MKMKLGMHKGEMAEIETELPPDIEVVSRLQLDIKVLKTLMDSPTPPLRFVRENKILFVRYGFVDASGEGLGTAWEDN